MGRKKKIQEDKITTNIKTELPIRYKGIVTTQKINKEGKIINTSKHHNKGGNDLFKFLLYCLTANYQESLRPYYIVPFFKDAGNNKKYNSNVKVALNNTEINKVGSDENAYYVLSYRVFLPQNIFSSNKKIDGYVIYSQEDSPAEIIPNTDINLDNFCMEIDYEDESILVDSDLLITWEIRLYNPE